MKLVARKPPPSKTCCSIYLEPKWPPFFWGGWPSTQRGDEKYGGLLAFFRFFSAFGGLPKWYHFMMSFDDTLIWWQKISDFFMKEKSITMLLLRPHQPILHRCLLRRHQPILHRRPPLIVCVVMRVAKGMVHTTRCLAPSVSMSVWYAVKSVPVVVGLIGAICCRQSAEFSSWEKQPVCDLKTAVTYGAVCLGMDSSGWNPWYLLRSWVVPFFEVASHHRICSFLRLEIRRFLFIHLHLPLLLGNLSMYIWIQNSDTLPETNMAPENTPLEKEIPIGNHHFWVLC